MSTTTSHTRARTRQPALPAFNVLAGLTSLGVLLQGLWAGLMVPVGEAGPYRHTWVEVHGVGADVTILLALATTVVALWKLRGLRALWVGSAVLTVLLALEAFLGGLVSDGGQRGAAAVHIPLALALMGVTVWLPFAARRATRVRVHS